MEEFHIRRRTRRASRSLLFLISGAGGGTATGTATLLKVGIRDVARHRRVARGESAILAGGGVQRERYPAERRIKTLQLNGRGNKTLFPAELVPNVRFDKWWEVRKLESFPVA